MSVRSLLPAGWFRSVLLLGVFVGALCLLILLVPYSQHQPWLALALFFGILGVFKLLSQFEKPAA